MNDHQENLRDEAAKAFNESLKKLEELWEETTEDPPEIILEELAAAAADIEEFFEAENHVNTPTSVTASVTASVPEAPMPDQFS